MKWPLESYDTLTKFYGEPGTSTTMLTVPEGYRMKLYGVTPMRRIAVHPKVHDATLRVLQGVLDHYGPDEIDRLHLNHFYGCLNVRKKQGGSSMSVHAWAAAFDFDAPRNLLRWNHKRAAFAGKEYAKWFELWYAEGAIGLGPEEDYDWMHVQFARRP